MSHRCGSVDATEAKNQAYQEERRRHWADRKSDTVACL